MKFEESLAALKEGWPMHRKAWSLEDGYLTIMPGMKYVWKIVLLPNPNAGNFIFSVEDFDADDWQPFVAPCDALEDVVAA